MGRSAEPIQVQAAEAVYGTDDATGFVRKRDVTVFVCCEVLPMSTTRETMSGLLTARSVAKMFDVHPKTVHRWAREGKIPRPVMRFTEPCWLREEIEEQIASMKRAELKELAS